MPTQLKHLMPSLLEQAAFNLETVAHLKGFEKELLPLAEHCRKVHRMMHDLAVVDLAKGGKAVVEAVLEATK